MKKFLSLILAVLMIVSAVSLVACDFNTDIKLEDVTSQTEAATTDTAATTTGGGSGGGGVVVGNTDLPTENDLSSGTEVEALGTLTPYQLYLAAGEQIRTATQFKMSGYQESSDGRADVAVALSANTAYQKRVDAEMWFVDGYTYQTDGTIKKKYETSFDEVKPSVLRYLMSYYISDIAEAKFDGVKLMKTSSDIYYFTLEFGDDYAAVFGSEALYYTMAFNAQGDLRQIEMKPVGDSSYKIVLMYEIGPIADYSVPADAHLYEEVGTGKDTSSGKDTKPIENEAQTTTSASSGEDENSAPAHSSNNNGK